MFLKSSVKIGLVVLVMSGSIVTIAYATHSWGNYHWARTANPLIVKLGDNVSTTWDAYLNSASMDWSISSVLDTTVVAGGTNSKSCKPTSGGRVEVCSSKYGNTGWLGLAQIWVSGNHITKAVSKLNDTYFTTAKYSTPGWRNLVMCQEVGHTFGLAHQDETSTNPNLGTCMDYTDDPDGTLKNQLSNEHPNQHDYDQLEAIYTHLDSATTIGQKIASFARQGNQDEISETSGWGKSIQKDGRGKTSLYERDLGRGEKVFTFVLWVE